jgi:hypothetical protein
MTQRIATVRNASNGRLYALTMILPTDPSPLVERDKSVGSGARREWPDRTTRPSHFT